jgi:hypothetical protein
VSPGEPFELGFGVDGAVRVRRTVVEERDTTLITGTKKLKRTITIYVSNLSGQPKPTLVTERVPVSEIEDVEIVMVDIRGWRHEAKDGLLRWPLSLGPRATETLRLVYEIRNSGKVELPF